MRRNDDYQREDIIEYRASTIIGTMHIDDKFSNVKLSYKNGTRNEKHKVSFSSGFEEEILNKLRTRNIFSNKSKKYEELEKILKDILLFYKNDMFDIKMFVYQKNDYVEVVRSELNQSDDREEGYLRINVIQKYNFDYIDISLNSKNNVIKDKCVMFLESYIQKTSLKSYVFRNEIIDVICRPGVGGHIIHEVFGHLLEADFIKTNVNILAQKFKIGDRIAEDNLTIVDDISLIDKSLIGLNQMDDEGSKMVPIELIKNGILNSYLCDYHLAREFEISIAGCARKQKYSDRTLPRMRMTGILPIGVRTLSEICNSEDKVVLLDNVMAAQVNPLSGDFIIIGSGLFIKYGLKEGIINHLVISGNILKTINSIDIIGTDFESMRVNCVKQGQVIPVGVGSPTIRIKQVRISGT